MPKLRRDAERNRQLLVAVAAEVFAEQGIDASLNEIARRSGVGNATLYRRFPTRADLYAAIFVEADKALRQIVEDVQGIENGWTALVAYCERICGLDATSRVAHELMMTGVPGVPSIAEASEHGRQAMEELVERAQRQGVLRADVTTQDVTVALCSVAFMIPAAAEVAPDAWRRHLALVLDGLRATGSTELPDIAPPTTEQFHQIMAGLLIRQPRQS